MVAVKDTIGQWLFDRVCEKLNLMEKDYFGLRFVDSEKQRFYPEDPMKLHEEITRTGSLVNHNTSTKHFYDEQGLISQETLHHTYMKLLGCRGKLGSGSAEVGDYDPEDHPPGYISEFKMLPKQTPKLEERVMEQHKLLHGQVPSEAEGNFLKKACTLDTYGVDPHQVKDQRGDQLYLGITHQGIMTFRGSRRTQLYKWSQIRRIAYEGKMFIVHISVNEVGHSWSYYFCGNS
nr:hypothetical protein BaRGS_029991 [Batillaria attramentaria]